jgi:hypothetical protein
MRGQFLLSGRIRPADAEPFTLAYATHHILTHPNLAADAWRRGRPDQALAELRASLGVWPWRRFGEATLRALAVGRSEGCRRCRATMLARVGKLPAPPRDAATEWLLGHCERCAPRPPRAQERRPAGPRRQRSATTPADLRLLPSDRDIRVLYASAGNALQDLFVRDMTQLGVHRAYDRLRARMAGAR